jgi:hypothetical protein
MDDRFTLVNAAQRLLGQNGAMSREETDYFLSRAEQELARARLSDHPDAVRAFGGRRGEGNGPIGTGNQP